MKKTVSILAVFLLANGVYSQSLARSSLNAFGNSVTKNGIHLSQTVGQSGNTSVITGENALYRQGFQQPVSHRQKSNNKNLAFTLFPNPTKGIFSIQFDERVTGSLTYGIFDSQGKLIDENKINAQISIEFNYALAPGMYTLRVSNEEGQNGYAKLIIIP